MHDHAARDSCTVLDTQRNQSFENSQLKCDTVLSTCKGAHSWHVIAAKYTAELVVRKGLMLTCSTRPQWLVAHDGVFFVAMGTVL